MKFVDVESMSGNDDLDEILNFLLDDETYEVNEYAHCSNY